MFGDPQAVAFKKAVLEAGGFVPLTGPMPWTAEFWTQMRVMVFEPFWARFGSLGAGPFPGSRLWLVYGAASVVIVLGAAVGVVGWTLAGIREIRRGSGGKAACTMLAIGVCAAGVSRRPRGLDWRQPGAAGRHGRPLDAAPHPAAHGTRGVTRRRGSRAAAARVRAQSSYGSRVIGMTIAALALAWLGVLRATILMFHFGY